MKAYPIVISFAVFSGVLLGGCGAKADSKSSTAKIPWSQVKQVEVTTEGKQGQVAPEMGGIVGPGASQSQVILAWGVPDYIHDNPADPEHKVWQYPNAVVVFQGTKVEKVVAR